MDPSLTGQRRKASAPTRKTDAISAGGKVFRRAAKISVQRSSVSPRIAATNCPVGSSGVPAVTGGAGLDCSVDPPPRICCAPLSSTVGAMPRYHPTRVQTMTTPMPTPPAPPGMPRDALASRSSSTLLLRRKSSVRMVHTRDLLGEKLNLEGVRNLSSVFRKFDHHLLVQPDIQRGRIVWVSGIVQFL